MPPAEATPAGREIWRNPHNDTVVHSYWTPGRHWLEVPSLARYYFGPESEAVMALPDPSADRQTVRDTYYRVVLPLVLQARGTEVLHASGIRRPEGVIALCAESETGKTTMAYGLSRRGYPMWADDAVAWRPAVGGFEAIPLPFSAGLRPPSLAFFAGSEATRGQKPLPFGPRSAAPLAAILVLTHAHAGAPLVTGRRMAPAAAFRAVLAHGQSFNLGDVDHKRRMLEHYLGVAAQVPVLSIAFVPGFGHYPAVLDAVEALLAQLPAPD